MADIDDVFDYVTDIFYWAQYTSNAMGTLMTSNIPYMTNALNALNINVDYLVNTIGGITAALNPIQNAVNALFPYINNYFAGLYNYLGPQFVSILSKLDDLALSAGDLLTTLTDLPQFFIDFLVSLMFFVKSLIETATRLIVTNMIKLQAALASTVVGMTSVIQNLVTKAINELGNSLIILKGLLDNILLTLTDSLHSVVQDIISVMSLITEAIIKNTNIILQEGTDGALRVTRAISSAKVTALIASFGGAAMLKVASLS